MEYAGYRTILEIQQGETVGPPPEPIWVAVAQIVDLGGPSAESDQIEVSHRDSIWRRYVAGMRDGGEVTFDAIFDPDHASHDPAATGSMYNLLESGEVNDFRIIFPGAPGVVSDGSTTVTFEAFVNQFAIDSPLEDGIKADLTLKITGQLTWTHTAPVNE